MERLTEKKNSVIIDARLVRKHAMEFYWRLKKYEDTGLTPDEILSLKSKSKGVEVVRCKDCMRCYKKRTRRNKQLMYICMRMDGNEYQVNANDFCSYGKRPPKESEQEE